MDLQHIHTLEEIIANAQDDQFPNNMGKKHYERYTELKSKFASRFDVELGAMATGIEEWITKTATEVEAINQLPDKSERTRKLADIFANDPIIFLNRHDGSHISMVQEKTLQILRCFNSEHLTTYEIYILLCASVVHDIGNITGRKEHERKIKYILDSECASILPDTLERTVISRVARAHGGGAVDTISNLKDDYPLYGFSIRERVLAAILRFADELADDYTRANYSGLKSDVISSASKIYHMYSSCLHTVNIQKNLATGSYEVFLAYSFDTVTACTRYGVAGKEKFLLDEIYDRTLKMERERRYCIRYMRPYCQLERIKVNITIMDPHDEFKTYPINYSLEEKGYPVTPYTTILDAGSNLRTGDEWFAELSKVGDSNEQ